MRIFKTKLYRVDYKGAYGGGVEEKHCNCNACYYRTCMLWGLGTFSTRSRLKLQGNDERSKNYSSTQRY